MRGSRLCTEPPCIYPGYTLMRNPANITNDPTQTPFWTKCKDAGLGLCSVGVGASERVLCPVCRSPCTKMCA